MPLPKGTRYRVKQTTKGPVRLAFMGKKVVEAKKMPKAMPKKHMMMSEAEHKKAMKKMMKGKK